MAFKRKIYKGRSDDLNEVFVCDDASDLSNLPADADQGSSAFVIATSKTYMIDSTGIWNEVDIGSGGGGGGSVILSTLNVTQNGEYNAASGYAYDKVNVSVSGEPADPTDGKTHIWIEIDEDADGTRLVFPLYWRQTVADGVSVDWGDGSAAETFSGTGAAEHEHTYQEAGEYEIVLTVTSGVLTLDGTSGVAGYALYGAKSNTKSYNRGRIKRLHVGNNVAVGSYMAQFSYDLGYVTLPSTLTAIGVNAFDENYSLKSVVIPDGVTSIGEQAFNYCYGLRSIEIPDSVTVMGGYVFRNCHTLNGVELPLNITGIPNYFFQGCYSLSSIDIPSGVTSIGDGAFHSCYSLTSMTIPSSVTSIGDSAFLNCYGILEYHIGATTPPTLVDSNAFTGISTDCVIYVPASTGHTVLNAYKSATNWSLYASRIVEEG